MNKSKKETLKLTKDLETEKSSHANDRERFRKLFKRQEQGFIELRKENKDLRKMIKMRNDQINNSIIDDLMLPDKSCERSRTESEKSAGEESENADVDGEAFMCNICYESVSTGKNLDYAVKAIEFVGKKFCSHVTNTSFQDLFHSLAAPIRITLNVI